MLYSAYTITSAPAKAIGATGIMAVLTAITFLASHELYANYVQALIYQPNSNKFVSSMTNFGQIGRSQVCFFAGLIVCSVANAVTTITIADAEAAEPAN